MTKAEQILAALGGSANVLRVEPSAMRLCVEVSRTADVDEGQLRVPGVFGVVRTGHLVQVIVGPEVGGLAAEIDLLRWAGATRNRSDAERRCAASINRPARPGGDGRMAPCATRSPLTGDGCSSSRGSTVWSRTTWVMTG